MVNTIKAICFLYINAAIIEIKAKTIPAPVGLGFTCEPLIFGWTNKNFDKTGNNIFIKNKLNKNDIRKLNNLKTIITFYKLNIELIKLKQLEYLA